jgi:hypothetical protein
MALSKSALSELLDALRAGGDLDVVREALGLVLQALIDAEATEMIGADRYQRTASRTAHRNGSRARLLSTKAGDVELRIPKLREGSFFPALLEPRRRIDRALLAVVMEAYVHGTSTRKVDDLVKALGVDSGISKSEVSRICGELDAEVAAFRSRSLAHTAFPYLFLDATYLKARVDGRVVSRAVVIATGVTADGGREVLGLDVGDSEDGAFWTAFLRSLKARGLAGVQLVVSDAHTGLKAAIAAVMAGASWQRCRVHWACADSSWWLAGGRCGVVGGDEGEHLCFAAKPDGRGWELEAVFLQQGKHIVDRVADAATAHVKQVGQCPLGTDLPQVQDGGQDPFRVGDLLLNDAPSGARQPVPAPALVAAPLDQGCLPDRQALHQQIQVGAGHAGQGWIGQLLMTA